MPLKVKLGKNTDEKSDEGPKFKTFMQDDAGPAFKSYHEEPCPTGKHFLVDLYRGPISTFGGDEVDGPSKRLDPKLKAVIYENGV